MTHFLVAFQVKCPSDWNELKVKEWVKKILTGKEKDNVVVCILTEEEFDTKY